MMNDVEIEGFRPTKNQKVAVLVLLAALAIYGFINGVGGSITRAPLQAVPDAAVVPSTPVQVASEYQAPVDAPPPPKAEEPPAKKEEPTKAETAPPPAPKLDIPPPVQTTPAPVQDPIGEALGAPTEKAETPPPSDIPY